MRRFPVNKGQRRFGGTLDAVMVLLARNDKLWKILRRDKMFRTVSVFSRNYEPFSRFSSSHTLVFKLPLKR